MWCTCGDVIMFLLAALSLLALVRCSPINGQDRCHNVRLAHQTYLNKQSHHSHSRGIIKDICSHGSASCCAGLELAIESKTRDHFVAELRSHLDLLRVNFEPRESRIRVQLASIFNETVDRVGKRYSERIAHANQELIKSVSKSVFRSNQPSTVDSHVDNLLRAIVVSEFESHSSSISAEYIQCLASVNFVDIFGVIRSQIARSMHTAIETSRLILQSFHLASKLLARAEQVRLDEKCVRQLAGTLHCGACLDQEPSSTRLCRSSCRDLVSMCIASSELASISQSWKDLTQSLAKLVNSMVAQRNPETIFETYPTLLNSALELVRSKNDISKKARVSCGPLERSKHNVGLQNQIAPSNEQYSAFSQSLFVSIESAAHLLSQHKDLIDRLQSKFCEKHPENNCLDNRPSFPAPIAQPLVNNSHVNNADDYLDEIRRYHSVVNTIQSSRLKLSNSTIYSYEEESNYSDDSLHDGSGSGNYPDDDTEPDDDDTIEGSGQPQTEPSSRTTSWPNGFEFTSTSTTPFPGPGDDEFTMGPTGSSASRLHLSTLLVSFVVLFGARHYCLW